MTGASGGLTVGATYWLAETGDFERHKPAAGNKIMLGIALSTTKLLLKIGCFSSLT